MKVVWTLLFGEQMNKRVPATSNLKHIQKCHHKAHYCIVGIQCVSTRQKVKKSKWESE